MKRLLVVLLVFVLLLSTVSAAQKSSVVFADVPKGNFYEQYIYKLSELDITNGIGNGNFGFNKDITRAEFLTFLVRLQQLEPDTSVNSEMFNDVKMSDWHYPYVNRGLSEDIIINNEYSNQSFEPNKPITREEMAVMIVRALKYDTLAELVNNQPTQFKDVAKNIGYIELAKDFGILNGRGKDSFAPEAKALRQEAAAMLIRMYNLTNNKLESLNGFYAIKSFNQIDKMKIFDSVGFGWSRIDINKSTGLVELTTDKNQDGQPFYLPEDYQVPLEEADKDNLIKYLMVFGSNEDVVTLDGSEEKLVSLLLNSVAAKQKLIADIIDKLVDDSSSSRFDGVVIDFEGLRDNGVDKQSFSDFITELKNKLNAIDKKLVVCINPPRKASQPYYDGYDFAVIGRQADYVILMAHDYEAKHVSDVDMQYFKGETPLAPIEDVYYAVKYTINGDAGIPKEKLLLQINFSSAQWQFKDDLLLNSIPYHPDYNKIVSRMEDRNITKSFNYAEMYQAPYFTYAADGVKNIIWYEDERSIAAKTELARSLGLKGISFWRLGLIPDSTDYDYDTYNLNIMSLLQGLKD